MQNCQIPTESAESGVPVPQAIPRPRVAVVDDEHIVADTLAEILRLHGYESRALYSGEAAVEDAKEFMPGTVLIDVRMQGIDGVEASIRIKKLHPTCRIILFTASPVRQAIQARISILGFEFLQRPLHPWDVLSLLRNGVRPMEVES
jgi:two-component system phosphoglycerate transport system response regulator PgtA